MSNNYPLVNSIVNRQSGIIGSNSFQSKLFKNRLSVAKNLFKKDLVSHYGCVNAIEFSNDGNFLTSGNFIKIVFVSRDPSQVANERKKSSSRSDLNLDSLSDVQRRCDNVNFCGREKIELFLIETIKLEKFVNIPSIMFYAN